MTVTPSEELVVWDGEIGNARFIVFVPKDVHEGTRQATATVHLDKLRIASIMFVVRIGERVGDKMEQPISETHHRKAFASYSSEDRDAVMGRIQGMQKVAPTLDVFLDVMRLRSGESWKDRIREEILKRDLLYLFWSNNARASKWVDWEWRSAFEHRGVSFIDPVPLEPPEVAAPPDELADSLHFNDWVLAYQSHSRVSPATDAGVRDPVPREFTSLCRRAKKQIERTADARLHAAYDAFIAGLKEDLPRERIEALGDALDDAYHDTRL